MTRSITRRFGVVLAVLALMFATSGIANATPLNLTPTSPDITASFLNFTYVGGQITISGDPAGLLPDNPSLLGGWAGAIGTYFLEVNPLPGVTFSMTDGTTTLLEGMPIAYGFATSGGNTDVEFIVNLTGGTLQGFFGPRLGIVGTITGWDGVSDVTAGNITFQNTDNFPTPVPEPASLTLLGAGVAAIVARRRRARS